jgi:predicted nucleotidyltransferase
VASARQNRDVVEPVDIGAAMGDTGAVRPLPPAVERLVATLARQAPVERVWLFGSRARGDARERSDVDLAVEAPAASEREWLALCELVEEADTLLPVDLIRLEAAPLALRRRIAAEGRVLHER